MAPPHLFLAVADMELKREHEAREEARELARVSSDFRLPPEPPPERLPPHVNPKLLDRFYADLKIAGVKCTG